MATLRADVASCSGSSLLLDLVLEGHHLFDGYLEVVVGLEGPVLGLQELLEPATTGADIRRDEPVFLVFLFLFAADQELEDLLVAGARLYRALL